MAKPVTTTVFILSPVGLKAAANSGWMGSAMEDIAGKIATATARNATMPEYANSMKSRRARIDGSAGAEAYTDNSFAHLEEWGSVNWSGTAPMRKAVRSLGFGRKFKEK